MEERKLIVDNIIDITMDNGSYLDKSKLQLEYSVSKYSSKKSGCWHLKYNDKNIGRRSNLIFKYKCVSCSSISSVLTIQFLRKLNKCSHRCPLCRNQDEEKRRRHSEAMKGNTSASKKSATNDVIEKQKEPEDVLSVRESSLQLFREIGDEDEYFSFHLTEEDYNRICKKIVSFQDGKFQSLENYEYWPIFKSSNQMVFTSVMYDNINKIIFKSYQPIMKCDNCGQNWRSKSIEQFKNCYKILCKTCLFTNKTFKIRMTQNCCGDPIMYQSKLELKFIDWCNTNLIRLLNGPNVKYIFNEIERTYRVDFQIKNTLIEIKDTHIWHRNNIVSGKWGAKVKAVNDLITNMKYDNFLLVQPTNWDQSLEQIVKI